MRVAVAYQNESVFQHFGHTEQFKIYDIEGGKIIDERIIDTDGNGHGAIAELLDNNEVDVLICGGIGDGAQKALEELDIEFYGGVSGKADDVVKSFVDGTLEYDKDVHCNHHESEQYSCGEHKCNEDKHGCAGNK